MPAAKLTARQRRFVDEYVADPNATQAAIRAGYSARTARAIGHENLTKPDIWAAVEEERAVLAERAGISRERIVEELKRVGFGDLRDAVEWGGKSFTLRDSKDLSPDAARAVREVMEIVTEDEDGNRAVRRSVKMHDKLGALRDLAKILGYANSAGDVPPGGVGVQNNFNLAGMPTNDLRRIERLIDEAVVPPPSS
jgi:phage terminase small subunit